MPDNGAMSGRSFLGVITTVVTREDFLAPGGHQRLYLGQKRHDGCTNGEMAQPWVYVNISGSTAEM